MTFIQGDIQKIELEPGSFHAVLMECVFSIVPDKAALLRRLHDLLRPGGRLGLTDVAVSGKLPPELLGVLAIAGCVGDARSLEEYRGLLEEEGFAIEQSQDLQETATSFLREIKGKLLLAEVVSKLSKLPVGGEAITEGKRVLAETQKLVRQGNLSYGLVIAQKPE